MFMSKKSSKIFKRLLKLLEKHLNLIVLLIFVFTCLYASWVFYNFVYRSVFTKPETWFTEIKVSQDNLKKTVEELTVSQKEIISIQQKNYQDIFK